MNINSSSLVSRRAACGEHGTCTPAALQHDLTLAAAEWAMQQRASEAGYTQYARKESLQKNEDAAEDCRDRVIIAPY